MALPYYLAPNRITGKGFMAISKIEGRPYTIEDVYDAMTHSGSTITKAEALAAFEEIITCMIQLIEEGNSIKTPLINILPRINGVFARQGDSFTAGKHSVKLRITAGARLREAQKKINVVKIKPVAPAPQLLQYHDHTTNLITTTITPGGVVSLKGRLLKINEADALQGIYYIHKPSGREIKATGKLVLNKPSQLIFATPPSAQLPAGKYIIEVRNTINNSSMLRTGKLNGVMEVQ